MDYIIKSREPASLFRFFEEISAIPHPSGAEQRIADYLQSFAQARGLFCYRDELHNIIIKKPASAQQEQEAPVILQGHTDMVCEKEAAIVHDFDTEGLKLFEKDGKLYANGTTLGADNGIAVALMLAVLDDTTLVHPALECVFTVQEETGLTGATNLSKEQLVGRRMINLDSESEGVATVSCAGGMRVRLFRDPQWKSAPTNGRGLKITVSSLTGGHSGTEICEEGANANKVMGRLLVALSESRAQYSIVEINGGNKDNAIPRECSCTILFNRFGDYDCAHSTLMIATDQISKEFAATDPELSIELSETAPDRVMSDVVSEAIVALLFLAPNGVRKRNLKAGGFVVCSLNMGVIKTTDAGVAVTFSLRSSVESMQKNTKGELTLLASRLGFAFQQDSEYPGWEYEETSELRNLFSSCYRELFSKELKIEAIHAGLECGIFAKKLEGLDAIAVGPNINDCHTPKENMELASCERFYKLLVRVLEKM